MIIFFSGVGGRITVRHWMKQIIGKFDFDLMSEMLPESASELKKWSIWYDDFLAKR